MASERWSSVKSTAASIYDDYGVPIIVIGLIGFMGVLIFGAAYLFEVDRTDYIALCQQEMKLTEGQCVLRYKELRMKQDNSTVIFMPNGR